MAPSIALFDILASRALHESSLCRDQNQSSGAHDRPLHAFALPNLNLQVCDGADAEHTYIVCTVCVLNSHYYPSAVFNA